MLMEPSDYCSERLFICNPSEHWPKFAVERMFELHGRRLNESASQLS